MTTSHVNLSLTFIEYSAFELDLVTAGLYRAFCDFDLCEMSPQRGILSARDRLCELAPQEAHALTSNIKGLSLEQASALLIALGDRQTFADRDQLVAFVGLDVRVRQSGK